MMRTRRTSGSPDNDGTATLTNTIVTDKPQGRGPASEIVGTIVGPQL
jgi:hypothetical protein